MAAKKTGTRRADAPRQRRTWKRLPQAVRKTGIIWGFMQEAVAAGSIEGASLRGAADRAGCTTPLVYRLFGSRRDLIQECVRTTYRTLLENLEKVADLESASALDRLNAIAAYVGNRELGDQEVFEGMVTLECRGDPKLAREYHAIFSRIAKLLETILRAGVSSGELRPDLEVEHYAWRLVDFGLSRNQAYLSGLESLRGKDFLNRAYQSLLDEITRKPAGRSRRSP